MRGVLVERERKRQPQIWRGSSYILGSTFFVFFGGPRSWGVRIPILAHTPLTNSPKAPASGLQKRSSDGRRRSAPAPGSARYGCGLETSPSLGDLSPQADQALGDWKFAQVAQCRGKAGTLSAVEHGGQREQGRSSTWRLEAVAQRPWEKRGNQVAADHVWWATRRKQAEEVALNSLAQVLKSIMTKQQPRLMLSNNLQASGAPEKHHKHHDKATTTLDTINSPADVRNATNQRCVSDSCLLSCAVLHAFCGIRVCPILVVPFWGWFQTGKLKGFNPFVGCSYFRLALGIFNLLPCASLCAARSHDPHGSKLGMV